MRHSSSPSVIFAFAMTWSAACAADTEEAPDDRIIAASHRVHAFALARPMPINVEYTNASNETWTLYQPDRFTGVIIRAVSDNRYFGRVSFSMAKFRRVEMDGIVMTVADTPPELTIEPGQSFSFDADLNSPFRSNLQPGSWNCTVMDKMEKLTSEAVPFAIVVTRDSVDRCLEVMHDESLHPYTRAWHGAYLAKVRPDLPFDFRGRDRTPEELEEVRVNNQEALEEFKKWWAENRDSEEVEQALERINEAAGVLDEYRALRDELEAAADKDVTAGESAGND